MYVVAYVRVSSEEQIKNYSLENQVDSCKRKASEIKKELVKIFRDEGKSAKNKERAGLLDMLSFCREKIIISCHRVF